MSRRLKQVNVLANQQSFVDRCVSRLRKAIAWLAAFSQSYGVACRAEALAKAGLIKPSVLALDTGHE